MHSFWLKTIVELALSDNDITGTIPIAFAGFFGMGESVHNWHSPIGHRCFSVALEGTNNMASFFLLLLPSLCFCCEQLRVFLTLLRCASFVFVPSLYYSFHHILSHHRSETERLYLDRMRLTGTIPDLSNIQFSKCCLHFIHVVRRKSLPFVVPVSLYSHSRYLSMLQLSFMRTGTTSPVSFRRSSVPLVDCRGWLWIVTYLARALNANRIVNWWRRQAISFVP